MSFDEIWRKVYADTVKMSQKTEIRISVTFLGALEKVTEMRYSIFRDIRHAPKVPDTKRSISPKGCLTPSQTLLMRECGHKDGDLIPISFVYTILR